MAKPSLGSSLARLDEPFRGLIRFRKCIKNWAVERLRRNGSRHLQVAFEKVEKNPVSAQIFPLPRAKLGDKKFVLLVVLTHIASHRLKFSVEFFGGYRQSPPNQL
jgi:hypothetical protein